ncbi:MAG: ATP-grasp domain-containing protein, partial [Wenzhouxiangella sp.]
NPFSPDDAIKVVPDFPFWIKPVKGHSSVLGYLVRDTSDLETALRACRQKIHYFGQPFNEFLDRLEDTSEIDGVDGNFAIAEALISAPRQFTLEGYVYRGDASVYGAVDSMRGGIYSSCFSRYQYPAQLPDKLVKRATGLISKLLSVMKYDNAPFNVEFFWNPGTDELHLLEINPRISKSHAPMFLMVDGASHHKVAIDLALGKKPSMPRRKGEDAVASKFMLRSFEADGIVRRVPSQEEMEQLSRILPDMEANILVDANTRLSSLFYQDSYSYELAEVFLGGRDEGMIEDAYNRCCDSLEFHIQPMPQNHQ